MEDGVGWWSGSRALDARDVLFHNQELAELSGVGSCLSEMHGASLMQHVSRCWYRSVRADCDLIPLTNWTLLDL